MLPRFNGSFLMVGKTNKKKRSKKRGVRTVTAVSSATVTHLLLALEVEAELPNQVLLFRRQCFGGWVVHNHLGGQTGGMSECEMQNRYKKSKELWLTLASA